MAVKDVTELTVNKKAYALAMLIFHANRLFPPEERYALTGQIRRSSRSVCHNFARLGPRNGIRRILLAS